MRIALAMILLPSAVAFAQDRLAIVEFDHATGAARLLNVSGARVDTTPLGDEPKARVPRGVPVEVRVVNTNTAIYRFSSEISTVEAPEVASVRGFSADRLMPYVGDLRSALSRSPGSRGGEEASSEYLDAARLRLVSASSALRGALFRLDDAIFARGGIRDLEYGSLFALEEMRRGRSPEEAARRVREEVGVSRACEPERPLRVEATEKLLTALTDLAAATQGSRVELAGPAFTADYRWTALRDTTALLQERGLRALGDFNSLVETAYRAERLASIVASACSRWTKRIPAVGLGAGREVAVTVQPREETETRRLADRGSARYEVELQARTLLRPAISIGGIAIPSARFAEYATEPVTGGYRVYEARQRDARFGLAGSLGFTWSALDARETRGMALWLPEITVATGARRGAGLGGAVSWSFLKLGAGALWLQQETLENLAAGDVIANESDLRTVDRYKPMLYLSLSVFEWAPFAARIPQ